MFFKLEKIFLGVKSVICEYRIIVLLMGFLAAVFFVMWKYGTGDLHDFGLNAFSNIIGMAITVFFIDHLIRNQEIKRQWPLKVAAFLDVQRFVDGLAISWLNVYNWSGKNELPPPKEPPSISEFLTLEYFNIIRQRLNLDAEACVFPKRTWWEYLPQEEEKYRQLGEKILERHGSNLDPFAYHLVYKMVNCFLDKNVGLNMLPVLRQTGGLGLREEFEKLPGNEKNRLGRYWVVLEDNLQYFNDLHNWYICHKREFLGHD
ncbi:hypothetical protein [Paludibacterium yongneupense]|nr:hypothetical protein [Paludibacterium yongneupense]